MKHFSRMTILAAALACAALPASAQEDYPSRSISFVVPFAAGGSTDILARLVGEALSQRIGVPVVIENRPGAGGNVGADLVAKANPDGYTMLMATTGIMAINDALYSQMSYSAEDDLEPVVQIASLTNVLVVDPQLPIQSVEELVAYAKENPGELTFASSGIGAATHLVGELFKAETGTDILHVPYQGSGPAMTDLMNGTVSMMFDQIASSAANIEAGNLRALGVSSATSSDALPDVPSIAEAGVPGFEALSFSGIVVPAGTPEDVVERLNTEVNAVLEDPALRERFAELGAEPAGGTAEAFSDYVATERGKWSELIETAGISVD